jgi:hypothetical protein
MFKNFMQSGAVHFVQVDCTRVAGSSEFLTVSLLARSLGRWVVPHVGDIGQIHQHLVLSNHIQPDMKLYFLSVFRTCSRIFGIQRALRMEGRSRRRKPDLPLI